MKLTDAQRQWRKEMELQVAREQKVKKRSAARSRIEDIKLAQELGLSPMEVIGL